MIVGIPKEIKNQEFRVGISPYGVAELVKNGHKVLVEYDAGTGSGITDGDYAEKGAEVVEDPKIIFGSSDMLLKVKEPQPDEFKLLRPGLITFSFLSLGANPTLANTLVKNKVTAIAYETIQMNDGSLPILKTMSAITGRLAIDIGSHYLKSTQGGSGKLLSGIAGAASTNVVILGAGVAGFHAAEVALNMGARVTVISRGGKRLNELKFYLGKYEKLETKISSTKTIAQSVEQADLLIGAVRSPGGIAPQLVTRLMVRSMQKGSVIIDACIDQGGCIETSHHTTHSEPIYWDEGVIHYCVPNMPGVVPRTATEALGAATLPYVQLIAKYGLATAGQYNPELLLGINTDGGHVVNNSVAKALGYEIHAF